MKNKLEKLPILAFMTEESVAFLQLFGKLRCTGEQRTGCMVSPVGCHLDNFAQFKRLKQYIIQIYMTTVWKS